MLTKRSLVFMSLARAGTDLVIFSRIQFVSRLSQLTDVRLLARDLARSKKLYANKNFCLHELRVFVNLV